MPRRLSLANLPTPLVAESTLGEELGIDLWIKRDDATGGPEAGNKIRKLEYLLADAVDQGADTIITCGGVQSNHARATAVLCARLGLRSVLLLRATESDVPTTGNLLLDRMVGADVRFITPDEYRRRAQMMAAVADACSGTAYVIPEGGSNGLGAFGYVEAMAEVGRQADAPFDVVVVACGSGGTAAGIALGARGVANEVRAIAVCNDEAYFEERITAIIGEARALDPSLGPPISCRVDARFKGPAYGVMTEDHRQTILNAARRSGIVLDPVYSGKAFHALIELAKAGELSGRILFLHTGGLPGLLARPDVLEPVRN